MSDSLPDWCQTTERLSLMDDPINLNPRALLVWARTVQQETALLERQLLACSTKHKEREPVDPFQQQSGLAAYNRPANGQMVGGALTTVLAPFGAPFITVHASLSPSPGSAWQITSGVVIVKIGCQTRLLQDWEENALEYTRDPGYPTPDASVKGAPNESRERLLRAFLALVRTAAPEPIP